MGARHISWPYRLGLWSAVLAPLGIAVTVLPDHVLFGGICLVLAAICAFLYYLKETDTRFPNIRGPYRRGLHVVVAGAVIGGLFETAHAFWPVSCECSITPVIVSRRYWEGALPSSAGRHDFPATSQELFYEWRLHLRSDRKITEITATINNLRRTDHIAATPTTLAAVSEFSERWMSGFTEDRNPDFFAKTVKFSDVPKGQDLWVIVRRKLPIPIPLNNAELIRLQDLTSPACDVTHEAIDIKKEQTNINSVLMSMITKWPLPMKDEKVEVESKRFIATDEFSCAVPDDVTSNNLALCTFRELEMRANPHGVPP
jgi:hypothetical protein